MSDRNQEQGIPPELWPVFDPWVDEAVEMAMRRMTPGRALDMQRRMAEDAMYRSVVEPVLESFEGPKLPVEDRERMWAHFVALRHERAVRDGLDAEPVESIAHRRRRWLRVLGMFTGAFVIVMAGFTGFWAYLQTRYYDELTTAPADTTVRALPDGSVARVAPSSWISYPEGMKNIQGLPSRLVNLTGAATFEVKQVNTGGSGYFEVYTPEARIVAVGTRFTVETRDSVTTVALEEGRLTVQALWGRKLGRMQVMRAGEQARVRGGEVSVSQPAVRTKEGGGAKP